MSETPAWRRYLRFWGTDPNADAQDELDFHFAERVDDLMAGGESEAEARAQAKREFGDVREVKRALAQIDARGVQHARRAQRLDSWGQDVRFGWRAMRRNPGFALVAMLTLALGIGGTTAVFSVVRAVLLAPLPYEESGALVRFYQYNAGEVDPQTEFLTGPHFRAARERVAAFENVAAVYTYRETGLDYAADGRATRLRVLEVSSDYFELLRARPTRGADFERAAENGVVREVVLSDQLWRTRFDRSAAVLHSTIRLSGQPYTVIGIAPEDFEDPLVGQVDVWLPIDMTSSSSESEDNHYLSAIGRLRNGVTMAKARQELGALNRALGEQWPHVADDTLIITNLKEDVVHASSGTLRLLLLAVGLVLLVACVNVANLFLVRATARTREFAVRAALGSGGGRIARQLLVESVLLAGFGGVLGLLFAWFAADALVALARDSLARLGEVGFDLQVLAFTAVVTLATGIAFCVAPAWRFARTAPSAALRHDARSGTGARGLGRLRTGLAIAQFALALTLVAGAGILMLSFARMQRVPLGMNPDHVLTFELALPEARYDAPRRALFYEQLAETLNTIPGVRAVGGTSRLPATGTYHTWGTRILTGPRAGTTGGQFKAEQRMVSGDYFDALRIPLLAGRTFDDRDQEGQPERAVVSATFAHEAFPGLPYDQLIGQQIAPAGHEREIIGVVGDVALDVRGASAAMVYHPHMQQADNRNWALTQLVASDVDVDAVLPRVRARIAALDPELVMHRITPMADVVGKGQSRERFALLLMGAFAVVAVLLAAIGLHGVLAYSVRQRTREIGVRVALGATRAHVRALVLGHATRVAVAGVALGVLGALALGRWLAALVYQTRPADPYVIGITASLLVAVALASAWLPARRAMHVNPQDAIRTD